MSGFLPLTKKSAASPVGELQLVAFSIEPNFFGFFPTD